MYQDEENHGIGVLSKVKGSDSVRGCQYGESAKQGTIEKIHSPPSQFLAVSRSESIA